MWKDNLGIEVKIQLTEEAAFYDDLDRGTLQMFASGWIMDYPDPENVLDLLFYSRSRQNNTRYENPEFDAIIEQARTELDVQKRLQLYNQAEQILLRDLPWVPLTFGVQHFVVQPEVKNYDPRAMIIPRLRFVTIER
jgi:ABC-type oligopeptide transport system substrate-binding subunit